MPDTLTIPKINTSFPEYLDWSKLREIGVKHIEQLGSDLWTDYNIHDPGITILEVLCYALADLGYRNNFDIKDLLTRSQESKNQEPKTIFGLPYDDNFFTAAEVLSCNPVTIDDYRKLLIDIPGIRNAWLEPAPEGEISIYFNRKEKSLQCEVPSPDTKESDQLCLRGLYDVCVELEPLLVRDACGSVFFSQEGILEKVYQKLCAHRNLCEDLREVIVFGEEQIAICADIELDSSSNPEDIMLEIYKQVEAFLSPTLRFYTLQEMLAMDKRVEEIFEGRPLTAESHGFIDPEDLKELDPKSHLYASDLYRIIMDIEGVLAVRSLTMANAVNGVAMTKGEQWCLQLTPKYRPHFDLDQSQLTFFKGMLPFSVNRDNVKQRYLEEKAASVKALLDPYQLDLPIPEGTHHELEDYVSIMNEFPLTYGIGEAGIKGVPDVKRKGQAKQLKGYLLFFDQLLANYLAQLANVRNLFSMRPHEEQNGGNHTYFTHLLMEVPGVEQLLKNLNDCPGNDIDGVPPEDFPTYLQYIAESIETYQERRNRFLDHLLARFSESFTDYVLLMFEINGKQQDASRIIQDKADFLQSYPDISRNRGKGYDYCLAPGCEEAPGCGADDTLTDEENARLDNVSGLEKRVSKLIGIDNDGWRNLAHGGVQETASGWGFVIQREGGEELLRSKVLWESEEAACEALQSWHAYICDENFYHRLTFDVAGEKEYAIAIVDDEKNELAISEIRYPSIARYCQAVDEYFAILDNLPSDQIEMVDTASGTFYNVKDSEGEIQLRFIATDNTPASLDLFRQNIVSKKYYCQKDFTVESNEEYGFILVNEADECIAESAQRYLKEEQREAVIHWLISQIKLPGLECAYVQETECYSFQLYNSTGEILLLESVEGFQTASDAMAFFDNPDTDDDFLGWAVDRDRYEKIESDGQHSFQLRNQADETVALHPYTYETEQECEDRLQAIIYYLDDVPPVTGVAGTPGTFAFEITDAAGNVLFQSVHTYPTTVEASTAAWQVRMLAGHRVYYRLLEDDESDLPFGFELLDRDGNPIATHPQWYETDCERDLAVDVIIYCSDNQDVQHQITERDGKFYFDLLDPEGEIMMKGTIGYPDEDAANAAWNVFLSRAIHEENYQIILSQIIDDPHDPGQGSQVQYRTGFALIGEGGEEMAVSACDYEYEAERIMALRAVINYLCHTEWNVEITGDPGEYNFWLEGTNGRKLLESIDIYPDEPTAKIALQNVLQLAQDSNNYFSLPDYTFELRDEDGNPVASHPQQYISDAEVEAAINLIVNYVRNDAPRVDFPNVGGAFQAVIFGENGQVVFEGTTIHPNEDSALEELETLLQYAACPDNYQVFEEEGQRCRFGFLLIDDEGTVVAVHPMRYPQTSERDDALLAVFAWLTYGEKLSDEVIVGKPDYQFVLQNNAGELLFTSVETFETVPLAEEAFTSFLILANTIVHYETYEESDQYGFRLKDGSGNIVAQHGTLYDTALERDEAMQVVLLFVQLRGANYRLFQEVDQEEWKFALGDHAASDFFLSNEVFEDKAMAAEGLLAAFLYAQDKDRYQLLHDEDACTYSFALTNTEGEVIGVYAGEAFATAEERDTAMCDYIDYLQGLALVAVVNEVEGTYCFVLNDFTGEVLLTSLHEYSTVQQTQEIWNLVSEAVCDPGNFRITYDNSNCTYTVEILVEGDPLAIPPSHFASRTEAQSWIDLIVLMLKEQLVQGGASGTDCGYYFLIAHVYNDDDNQGEEKTILLQGIQHYPKPSDALRACHESASFLQDEEHFYAVQVDDTWQLVLVDENGEPVAFSQEEYEVEATALEDRDRIMAALTDAVPLTCDNSEQVVVAFHQGAFHCLIMDQGDVWLKSREGELANVLSSESTMYHSRSVRDFEIQKLMAAFNEGTDVTVTVSNIDENHWEVEIAVKGLKFVGKSIRYPFDDTADEEAITKYVIELGKSEENYRLLDETDDCLYGFDIVDSTFQKAAWEHCNQIHELAQQVERYSLITNEEECLYGFELTDNDGIPIASHPVFYQTSEERDAAILKATEIINCEGIHLVEHILLRPLRKGMEQCYAFELYDNQLKIPCLQSVPPLSSDQEDCQYTTEKTAWEAFLQVWVSLWHYGQGETSYVRIIDDLEGLCPFSFEILNQGDDAGNGTGQQVIAIPAGPCHSAAARDELLQKLVDLVKNDAAAPTEMPNFPEPYQAFVNPLRLSDELVGDDFLPPVLGHIATGSSPSPAEVDPYSFRATVVLPYWPARFQQPEFRAFLETTLRQEAPAHIFLRICWVDACQMQAFEQAYCQWMITQSRGEDSCDAALAKNNLIAILRRIRSIYPAASLHDCNESSENGNRIILNYSIIGSANSQ